MAPPYATINLQKKNHQHGGTKMKQQFALILNSDLAINKGFSLDELVHEAKALFETEGLPGFLRIILLMGNSGVGTVFF